MTTTSVDDAVILPQSQGTGLSGEDAVIDASINGVLNRYVGGEYVATEYSTGLQFQNHDGTNDAVEVGPGICFIQDNSTSTGGERSSGGNPQAESSTTSGYDTELPEGHTYAVLLPTATQISVSDSTLNEVYVDIDDVTANNSVNLEHDGSSTASPGSTSLKIGETNPDDASADTRANDDASPTYNSLTVNGTTDTDDLNAGEADVTNETFIRAESNGLSNVSAGSFENPFDVELDDNRDEFNSSGQFVPDKSGEYEISASIQWFNLTDGDKLEIKVQDVDNNNRIGRKAQEETGGSDPDTVQISHTFKLTAGTKYEIQTADTDSQADIGVESEAVIKRSIVQS